MLLGNNEEMVVVDRPLIQRQVDRIGLAYHKGLVRLRVVKAEPAAHTLLYATSAHVLGHVAETENHRLVVELVFP